MTLDHVNKHLAVFYVVVGFAGSLPALYPIAGAIGSLFDGHSNTSSRLGAAGLLSVLAVGYVLMFGYLRYLSGGDRHPIVLWSASLAYNAFLTLAFLHVSVGSGYILWAAWPILLTSLSGVAIAREYKLLNERTYDRAMWS